MRIYLYGVLKNKGHKRLIFAFEFKMYKTEEP